MDVKAMFWRPYWFDMKRKQKISASLHRLSSYFYAAEVLLICFLNRIICTSRQFVYLLFFGFFLKGIRYVMFAAKFTFPFPLFFQVVFTTNISVVKHFNAFK